MRTIKILLFCAILSLELSSCQKFVDIKKSSSQGKMTTASDCQQLLDNYTYMNTNYPVDAEISADDYFVIGDSYKDNVIPQIPTEEKDLHVWLPTARRSKASPNWQGPYFVTYNANLVLETLDKIQPGTEDPTLLNTLKGSALFYRGYALWFVAQLYTKPYSAATAGQDPGVPVRLSSDINVKSSRGTVQETYDFIIKELQEAVGLLPATSSIPTRPNKVAAYAMLARVYLSMEDYSNALINANAALQLKNTLVNYNTISPYALTPFTRYNPEVIFHSITFSSPILAPNFGFNNTAKIAADLVNSYDTNDLRRQIFLKENSGIHAGTYRFSGNYEEALIGATFFDGLAVDELYLIRAECYARAGKTIEAMKDLNDLLVNRWLDGTYTNLSAGSPDEALSTILTERRKELLMRGLRWTDLRRLNKDPRFKKDLTRSITINGTTNNYILPANDGRYTLLIPDEVINNTKLPQNIR